MGALRVNEGLGWAMPLVLHGYRYSVYLRIVRLALAEKGGGLRAGRSRTLSPPTSRWPISPSIRSAGCRPWFTTISSSTKPAPSPAISIAASPAPPCSPDRRAPWPAWTRSSAWSIPTATGRWCARSSPIACSGRRSASRPTRPRSSGAWPAAAKVLAALEALVAPDASRRPDLSLADLHLGAMIAYFAAAPAGAALLQNHPRLAAVVGCSFSRRPSCCRDRSRPAERLGQVTVA